MKTEDDRVVVRVEGRVDSNSAPKLDDAIRDAERSAPDKALALDFGRVSYISSAGLRVLLAAAKRHRDRVTVCDVSPEIYDIMDTTGFTTLLDVERRMRVISVEGCEVIGVGAIGTVYRIDPDTIVKVFRASYPLEMIRDEQRRAKRAFIKGVPTAIPYDVVRVGDCYGSVFELVNARTYNDVLAERPEDAGPIIRRYAELVREVHAIQAEPGELPDCRETYLGYLDAVGDAIPRVLSERLRALLRAMPEDLHLIHGDLHMKNILLSGDEPLLIDMDMLSVGDPVFDYAGIYVAYRAFLEHEPDNSMAFLGIPGELCERIWRETLAICAGAPDGQAPGELEKRAVLVGGLRFLYLLTVIGLGAPELREIRIRSTIERLSALAGEIDSLATRA